MMSKATCKRALCASRTRWTPKRPWECVSMDFIVSLPKSEGFGSIMVVVDRFSKHATFIPAAVDCTAEEAAQLFLHNVVKL